MVQFEKEGTDDIIQAGAQSAAGDDAGAGPFGIEEQFCARASQLKKGPSRSRRLRALDDLFRDAEVVADRTSDWRGESRFTQHVDCHKLINTGSQAPTVFVASQVIAISLFAVPACSTTTLGGNSLL
jgi:hypothetical protein